MKYVSNGSASASSGGSPTPLSKSLYESLRAEHATTSALRFPAGRWVAADSEAGWILLRATDSSSGRSDCLDAVDRSILLAAGEVKSRAVCLILCNHGRRSCGRGGGSCELARVQTKSVLRRQAFPSKQG